MEHLYHVLSPASFLITSEDGEENLSVAVYEDKETVSSGHIRIAPPVSHNFWDSTQKSKTSSREIKS